MAQLQAFHEADMEAIEWVGVKEVMILRSGGLLDFYITVYTGLMGAGGDVSGVAQIARTAASTHSHSQRGRGTADSTASVIKSIQFLTGHVNLGPSVVNSLNAVRVK